MKDFVQIISSDNAFIIFKIRNPFDGGNFDDYPPDEDEVLEDDSGWDQNF